MASTGWETKIVFDIHGIPQTPQTDFSSTNLKTLKAYLPLYISNRSNYITAKLRLSKLTIPKAIIEVTGLKSATDLNCFEFDITNTVNSGWGSNVSLGLCELVVIDLNTLDTIFQSKAFKLPISKEDGVYNCTCMKKQ